MKIFTSVAVIGGFLLFTTPVLTLAGTYQYVDTNGNLQMTVASTPLEAIETAPNRAPHSGVMEVGVGGEGNAFVSTNTVNVGTAGTEVYAYVSVNNSVKTIVASNPDQAIEIAPDRMSNSGVILVSQ